MMRFDDSYREDVRLRNGERVLLRPVTPDDKALLLEGFARLSGRSRYARFLSPRKGFTDSELEFLTEVDGVSHFAIAVAKVNEDGSEEGVAIARFIRLSPRISKSPCAAPWPKCLSYALVKCKNCISS